MPGKSVIIGRYQVAYFPAGEEIEPPHTEAVGFDQLEDKFLRSHPRLRRVLTTLVRPLPKFYGVLHWSDGTDLVALDRTVGEGKLTDGDVSSALLAEPRTIVCSSCEAQFRCLAVDTGQALFAATLADRLRAHELKENCPVCGGRLGVPVVEFL